MAKSFSYPIPYQNKLNTMSEECGIIYEMNSVSKLTIIGMYNLDTSSDNVYVIKFENLIHNFDNTIKELCIFLNIDDYQIEQIIRELQKENLSFLKDNNINMPSNVTNIDLKHKRYTKYWNNNIQYNFDKIFPSDLLKKLNYL